MTADPILKALRGADSWLRLLAKDRPPTSDVLVVIKEVAQAIEARRAETQSGSVHESAVHAPKTPQGTDK